MDKNSRTEKDQAQTSDAHEEQKLDAEFSDRAPDAAPVDGTVGSPERHEHLEYTSEYTDGKNYDEHNEELADFSAEEQNPKENKTSE